MMRSNECFAVKQKCMVAHARGAQIWRVGVILLMALLCGGSARADRNLSRLGYTLSWHDEFDGTNLNTSKWNVSLGPNNANAEWEVYSAPNVYVQNGSLILKGDKVVSGGNTTYT